MPETTDQGPPHEEVRPLEQGPDPTTTAAQQVVGKEQITGSGLGEYLDTVFGNTKDYAHYSAGDSSGLTLLSADEQKFINSLDAIGCRMWVAAPCSDGGKGEFYRPTQWQKISSGNQERLAVFVLGSCVCLNTGGVIAVLDVDPRNGGDVESVRKLLADLKVRIFAEVATPSGGRHFYIAGHDALPNVHCSRLVGFPGVDVQSFGCNVFLPGTQRPKYDGAGYEIVFDDLDALGTVGDPEGAAALSAWVSENLPRKEPLHPPSDPGTAHSWTTASSAT